MTVSDSMGLNRRELIAIGAIGGAFATTADAIAQETSSYAAAAVPPDHTPPLSLVTNYAELRRERISKLDPEMRAIYGAAQAAPPLSQIGLAKMRAQIKSPASKILAKGVTAYNIRIPGPAGDIPARVYMPEGARQPVGCFLSTHGGGWVFGDGLENWDAFESKTALDWGCAVIHPDFRIAPEHKFPAAIDDCYAALQYLGRNSAKMGIDAGRIGIGGGCAGANIATAVSLLARDAKRAIPAIQFLWSGCFDMRQDYESYFEFANGYGLRKEDDAWVKTCYLRSEEDRWDWRASPVLAETLKGAPPALFWVGEWEILRDENHLYANRMREAGCTVHFIEGEKQGHGFIFLNAGTKYARADMAKITRIMRSYIGPESAKRTGKPASIR